MSRLPTIQPPADGETLHGYGCRVLAFVLETGCTATLSDQDLELADHVYPVAIAHPEVLVLAVDRLSAARTEVLAALARRRRMAEVPPVPEPSCPPVRELPGGRLSPLQPQPIARPPAGMAVDIHF